MVLELSNLTFTEQDDIVPASGMELIVNSAITNTLAGSDVITGRSEGTSEGLTYSFRNFGTLNTGEGNDQLTGTLNDPYGFALTTVAIYNEGAIDTGNGNDIITAIIQEAVMNTSYAIFNIEGTIDTGDGNDTIIGITPKGTGILSWDSNINTGDGNDNIIGISTAEMGSGILNLGIIDTGNSNDIITGTGNFVAISNDGIINTGNGEDFIISQGKFSNSGVVFLEDGNDSLLVYASLFNVNLSNRALENYNAIDTGEGDDLITSTGVIYNEGIINTGNGNDSIFVNGGVDGITGNTYGIYNNGGAINMGDGNDSIIANGGFESAPNSSGAWFLGEGKDYIKGYGSGDFYGGNGNDTLELTPGTYTVGIWDRVVFAKGNSLMLASEFEQLIAGDQTYDFANLTAGQIIVVA